MLTIISTKPELRYFAQRLLAGIACAEEIERQSPADVIAIKSDTGEIHYRTVIEARAKKPKKKPDATEPDDDEMCDMDRCRKFIASDETVDRYGDIIRVAGWKFDNFAKNPQALMNHNQRGMPIGKVTEWVKGKHQGRKVLKETIEFLTADLSPEGDLAMRMVDAGALRTTSVGFLPIRVNVPKTNDERSTLGLGPMGVEFVEQEQLELSVVTIPANPNAEHIKEFMDEVREMERELTAAPDWDGGESRFLNSILSTLEADGTLTHEMAKQYRSIASTRQRTLFASVEMPEAPADPAPTEEKAPDPAPVAQPTAADTMKSLTERVAHLEGAVGKLATALLQVEKDNKELAARLAEGEKRLNAKTPERQADSSKPDAGTARSLDAARYFAKLLSD